MRTYCTPCRLVLTIFVRYDAQWAARTPSKRAASTEFDNFTAENPSKEVSNRSNKLAGRLIVHLCDVCIHNFGFVLLSTEVNGDANTPT